MKILYTNPFGESPHWNARMRRMVELLREEGHEVKELLVGGVGYSTRADNFRGMFKDAHDSFKPDVVITHGAMLASHIVQSYGKKIVVDLGSFDSSEYMIQRSGYVSNYRELMEMKKDVLFTRLDSQGIYQREKFAVNGVKAVLTFEGLEYDFAKRIFPEANVIAHSPFYVDAKRYPKLPFELRENKIVAFAAKWGRKSKNGKFIFNFNNAAVNDMKRPEMVIWSVGHGGRWMNFMPHDDVMKVMGQVKVVLCPMITGNNMVIAEATLMGANVIVQDAHPLNLYTSGEISFKLGGYEVQNCAKMVDKAFGGYYPPKNLIPDERTQIRKLIDILKI